MAGPIKPRRSVCSLGMDGVPAAVGACRLRRGWSAEGWGRGGRSVPCLSAHPHSAPRCLPCARNPAAPACSWTCDWRLAPPGSRCEARQPVPLCPPHARRARAWRAAGGAACAAARRPLPAPPHGPLSLQHVWARNAHSCAHLPAPCPTSLCCSACRPSGTASLMCTRARGGWATRRPRRSTRTSCTTRETRCGLPGGSYRSLL